MALPEITDADGMTNGGASPAGGRNSNGNAQTCDGPAATVAGLMQDSIVPALTCNVDT